MKTIRNHHSLPPVIRLLLWTLIFALVSQPIATVAQRKRTGETEGKSSRSAIETFSSRGDELGGQSELPLGLGTISKAAFDAIIKAA